ncbi:MAG: DNA polymerase III subunit gamma/tau [Candidatus Dependentiae bacterium]|nr:DNA polymerase III subunit gamma/tau [Candidatus Dependentiae bacterium]
MNTTQLNLARKWRSKNFDQIVGQDLSVRILKNTLYLNQFFPVYLFSGQRGCGKTSTARIFAAAINCEQLDSFQKNPKQSLLPCSTCASCVAMTNARHPDFIEIDAASHTGVDNVRQIVEAASLLPILGRKKIYLIDEAHMLSKAAFNAFLKVLEEPPMAVVFILATTDAQKIIETVRSRCFQLFFKPIEQERLIDHLAHICMQENIKYERDALSLIINESGGSVRDAINILEQVRFSSTVISSVAVRQVLGHIDDERLLQLVQLVFKGEQKALLTFCATIRLTTFDAAYIWKSLIRVIRALLWRKHGVANGHHMVGGSLFETLVKEFSLMQVQQFLEHLYQNELIFSKTTSQHILLEMILLHICSKNNRSRNNSESSPLAQAAPGADDVVDIQKDEGDGTEEISDEEESDTEDSHSYEKGWPTFIDRLADLNDPLLRSIFSQGNPVKVEQQQLLVSLPAKLLFFKDWLYDTKNVWLPVLQTALPDIIDIKPLFVEELVASDVPAVKVAAEITIDRQPQQRKSSATVSDKHEAVAPQKKQFFSTSAKKTIQRGVALDTSDKEQWPQTNLILRHFPGMVTELKESKHE